MTNFEKFREKLRSKEKFYSSLTGKKISDKEYDQVFNVWNKFEMKTMKDYHDLYLKCDVLLLADVFKKFTNISWLWTMSNSLFKDTRFKLGCNA